MKIMAFDTETTGLIGNHTMKLDKQPELIEFYGCIVDLATGEIGEAVNLLVKPVKPIKEGFDGSKITQITGIDDVLLEDERASSFNTLKDIFYSFIETAPGVLAHNLSFDMEIMDLEFERRGMKVTWPNVRICTVEQTVHLKGYRLSLAGLHELLFGEAFPEAHRAKNDVTAMVRCAVELFKRGEI